MPPTEVVIGILAAVAVMLITYGVAARPSQDAVQARLEQLVVQPKSLEEYELQQPLFERVLRPLVQRLARVVNRGDQGGLIARTDAKLERAGYPGGLRGADWMGVKLLSTIVVGIAVGLLALATGRVQLALVFGLAGAALGFMAPEFWLGSRGRKRSFEMVLQLPDALDLLTISVEAGLGFDAALVKVTEKMKGPLSDEFKRAAGEQRVGKSRQESLRGITERVDVKEFQNFISAIIQADQLGVSMSKVLRIQSEQLRQARRQRAEEKAARAPILIMLPTVGCIFPSLFIVILAPAALTAMSSCGSV